MGGRKEEEDLAGSSGRVEVELYASLHTLMDGRKKEKDRKAHV